MRQFFGANSVGGLSAPIERTVRRPLGTLAEVVSWIFDCSIDIKY
jgi:hypothetical protein